ncbi:MAG: hypothetical protein WC850_06350 [Candidatus Gracilibacteria bacterium]
MNKKYISYIGTSLAIIIVGAFLIFNVQKTNSPGENEFTKINTGVTQTGSDNLTNTDTKTDSESMSIWQKFTEGKIGNIKCEIVTEQEGGKNNQIIYISGKKIRMDMTISDKAGNSENHMLTDGEYTYIWGSTGPAFKMKNIDPNKTENQNNENTTTPQNTQDMSKDLEQIPYNKCSEWKVLDSMFKLPDGIEFTDMETFQKDMMNQATKGMTEDQINQLKNSMPKIN